MNQILLYLLLFIYFFLLDINDDDRCYTECPDNPNLNLNHTTLNVDINSLYNQTFMRLLSASHTPLGPINNVSAENVPWPQYWPILRPKFTSNNNNKYNQIALFDDNTASSSTKSPSKQVLKDFLQKSKLKSTPDALLAFSRFPGVAECLFNLNTASAASLPATTKGLPIFELFFLIAIIIFHLNVSLNY